MATTYTEEELIERLVEGRSADTPGIMFILKNKFNWTDHPVVDQNKQLEKRIEVIEDSLA